MFVKITPQETDFDYDSTFLKITNLFETFSKSFDFWGGKVFCICSTKTYINNNWENPSISGKAHQVKYAKLQIWLFTKELANQ